MKRVVLLKSQVECQGGLEKYAGRIAKGFVEKGAQVTILTTPPPSSPSTDPHIEFHGVKTIPWPAFVRMEQYDGFVRKWLKNNPADIVFGMDRNREQTHIRAGNGVHSAYLESRILTEGYLKHLLCLYNPLHRKILQLEKAAFENPRLKKLFTNSFMVRRQILDRYIIDPDKIVVIHNGVEWYEMERDFSHWSQERKLFLHRHQLDPSVFHFLFIGNGYLRKGLDKLLEGLSALSDKKFHLSVVGKDNNQAKYQAKSERLGIGKQVRFFGQQKDIRPFYQLADVLVIPSFYDPFANVTVEALAMGLHVVSSSFNGGSEILTPQNGSIIENLLERDSIVSSLNRSMTFKKTENSALASRLSVKHLDFSLQMNTLIEASLG